MWRTASSRSCTHHNGHVHLSTGAGQTVLNAEDFYATLVVASGRYFADLRVDPNLQTAFIQRVNDPDNFENFDRAAHRFASERYQE